MNATPEAKSNTNFTRPKVEKVSIDETGEEFNAPKWFYDQHTKLSDASLKTYVLVGSIPED